MSRRVVFALVFLFALKAHPQAQAPPSRPSFEVASIKINKAGSGKAPGSTAPKGTGGVLPPQGDRLRAQNVTLRTLILYAYGQQNADGDAVLSLESGRLAGGPSWMGSDAFDIEARLPPRSTPAERALMMRALLEDRFSLRTHREQRDMPVYLLMRARTTGDLGKQLQPRAEKCVQQVARATGEATRCGVRLRPGWFFGNGVFLSAIARYLSGIVDRVVIDRTELTGRFDFDVRYAEAPGIGQPAARPAPANPDAPSIFVAVQEQLGLKLEATRAPIDVVVVDNARRPSAN
jgi:uncharacterized protein (TIGR03435 family)